MKTFPYEQLSALDLNHDEEDLADFALNSEDLALCSELAASCLKEWCV